MVGDDHDEAYTAIVWGVGLSHEMAKYAEAEVVNGAEGYMCGTAMQGPVALPGSEATSRTKGSRRNLGDLAPPTATFGWFRAATGSRGGEAVEEGARSRTG